MLPCRVDAMSLAKPCETACCHSTTVVACLFDSRSVQHVHLPKINPPPSFPRPKQHTDAFHFHRRSTTTSIYPPESNALSVGKPVTATASCGTNPDVERGCNSTCPHGVNDSEEVTFAEGSIKPYSLAGQPECKESTDVVSTRLNRDAHPPQLAVDGDSATTWQSPAGMPRVTFAVDLGTAHEAWLVRQNNAFSHLDGVACPCRAQCMYRGSLPRRRSHSARSYIFRGSFPPFFFFFPPDSDAVQRTRPACCRPLAIR